MAARETNRAALLGAVALSTFATALAGRLLDRFGVIVDPGIEVGVALVGALLLYPWIRPKRQSEAPLPTAGAPPARAVAIATATLDVEEEPHAGL